MRRLLRKIINDEISRDKTKVLIRKYMGRDKTRKKDVNTWSLERRRGRPFVCRRICVGDNQRKETKITNVSKCTKT